MYRRRKKRPFWLAEKLVGYILDGLKLAVGKLLDKVLNPKFQIQNKN